MAVIISAPFGNRIKPPNCIPTLGTYTLYKRAGFLKRWWRVLSTVRYNWRQRSWINKLGLPSPGIEILTPNYYPIISIHGFNKTEWDMLAYRISYLNPKYVELNLSCPNVNHKPNIDEIAEAIKLLQHYDVKIIAKIPPIKWMDYVIPLYDLGIARFHCCNTIPTPGGGISGKPLKQYSLWCIEQIRNVYPSSIIIGGGGITNMDDVQEYLKIGANHCSIGSMLFNILNWRKIKDFIKVANQPLE